MAKVDLTGALEALRDGVGFMCFKSWTSVIESLPPEDFKTIFLCIAHMADSGKMPTLDDCGGNALLYGLTQAWARDVLVSAGMYKARSETNRKNGSLGGRRPMQATVMQAAVGMGLTKEAGAAAYDAMVRADWKTETGEKLDWRKVLQEIADGQAHEASDPEAIDAGELLTGADPLDNAATPGEVQAYARTKGDSAQDAHRFFVQYSTDLLDGVIIDDWRAAYDGWRAQRKARQQRLQPA